MISVLIVDDSQTFCQGLKRVLEQDPEIQVVGMAEDAATGLALADRHRPDVILVDLRLRADAQATVSTPAVGLDFLRQIRRQHPGSRTVVITNMDHPGWVRPVQEAGAQALLHKDCASTEIVRVVHLVAQGYTVWSGEQQAVLASTVALTPREQEVLALAAQELTDGEIAGRLGIGTKTVQRHMENIRGKLGVRNRRDAVRRARELGLLPPAYLYP